MGKQVYLPPQGAFCEQAQVGYRALAASVLIKAAEDWARYHSQQAEDFRDGVKFSKGMTGVLMDLCSQPDPYDFLVNDSNWHQMAGVHPDEIRRKLDSEDPQQFLRQMRALKRVYFSAHRPAGGNPNFTDKEST